MEVIPVHEQTEALMRRQAVRFSLFPPPPQLCIPGLDELHQGEARMARRPG
ncbi:hypothetical protein AB0G67_45205 [Streptomyces sp. NPDC021056]|uniref:hypothetical protein n=1 Tax=Streptomyces sp. NPDC021056 TaxID=3155012 RepID=UPI0033FC4E20